MKNNKLDPLDYLQLIIIGTAILMLIAMMALGIIWLVDECIEHQPATAPNQEMQLNNSEKVVKPTYKKNYYNVTEEERYLLAKLAHAEGSICSQECQEAIISVVFNRLESGKWKKDMNGDGKITIYDIIYYPNAFTPATNGAIDKWEPTAKDYAAVDVIVENGPSVPTYVRYFRASYDFSWEGYKNYMSLDNVYFGYFENWKQGAW